MHIIVSFVFIFSYSWPFFSKVIYEFLVLIKFDPKSIFHLSWHVGHEGCYQSLALAIIVTVVVVDLIFSHGVEGLTFQNLVIMSLGELDSTFSKVPFCLHKQKFWIF